MTRTRYQMGMTPPAWTKLKALARTHYVSLTDIVIYLSEQQWHRTARAEGLWLKVGARPWNTAVAITGETVSRYHEIAHELFIVSLNGSQDYPGLVLQTFCDGLVAPARVAPHSRPVVNHAAKKDIRLSRVALAGIRSRIRPAKSIGVGLNKLAARKPTFMFVEREVRPARRYPYRLYLKHDTIEFFADEALRLGLRPVNVHGRISWASLFIEEFGRGRVLEAGPRQMEVGEPYELTPKASPPEIVEVS